jgi:catechol 2,3-dioxygenase-like lactoylglutathione lyase family enzyme
MSRRACDIPAAMTKNAGTKGNEGTLLGAASLTAFLPTRDPARARDFYERQLGLRLVEDDAYALVFDANGTMLRIQIVDSFAPHPFTALGWQVADIDAVADALAAKGIATERYAGMDQDARGIWNAPSGARVAWFEDPDGNTLSITQH